MSGPVVADLLPPVGASTGPTAGYKAAVGRLALGVELELRHAIWTALESGSAAWLVPAGDLYAGVSF